MDAKMAVVKVEKTGNQWADESAASKVEKMAEKMGNQ